VGRGVTLSDEGGEMTLKRWQLALILLFLVFVVAPLWQQMT
jgi:hypothetical protein